MKNQKFIFSLEGKNSLKAILLFLFFFSFINLASAAQPSVVTTSPPTGLQVDTLLFGELRQNSGFMLHTHVYNVSSGINVSNSTTKCYAHLYNSTGNHILRADMSWDGKGDFEAPINGNNFTKTGSYAAETWCTIGNAVGGSERLFFEVKEAESANIDFFIVFGVLAIILLFLGIYVEDSWVTSFGGLIFTGLGLYCLINGLGGFRNNTTSMISLLVTMFGIYVMVKASLEQTK